MYLGRLRCHGIIELLPSCFIGSCTHINLRVFNDSIGELSFLADRPLLVVRQMELHLAFPDRWHSIFPDRLVEPFAAMISPAMFIGRRTSSVISP
jgi:hypothetical protein